MTVPTQIEMLVISIRTSRFRIGTDANLIGRVPMAFGMHEIHLGTLPIRVATIPIGSWTCAISIDSARAAA